MSQSTYPIIGFSARGNDLPQFVVAFFRKEDGHMYALYPYGNIVKIIGADDLNGEQKLFSRKNVWRATAPHLLSLDGARQTTFAFSYDHIAFGDMSKVKGEIAEQLKLVNDQFTREGLEEAIKSLP